MKSKECEILIAIPDPGLSDLIAEFVVELGFHSIQVFEEWEAVSACKRYPDIAVTVVDWELSVRYFPQLLDRLQQISPFMDYYIIHSSSLDEIRSLQQNSRICGYQTKPLILEKFKKGIFDCLDQYGRENYKSR
jgi:DNA-binding NtrC family response regulator